jgi:hypothetical protein
MRDERKGCFRDDLDRNLGSIKMKILALSGKNDNEKYLDLREESRVNFLFSSIF